MEALEASVTFSGGCAATETGFTGFTMTVGAGAGVRTEESGFECVRATAGGAAAEVAGAVETADFNGIVITMGTGAGAGAEGFLAKEPTGWTPEACARLGTLEDK